MDKKGVDILIIILISAVLISAVAIVVYLYLNRGVEQQTSPNLAVNLLTLTGKAKQLSTLNVSIRNDGGDARGVVVYLACDAFESRASSSSKDVSANETTTVLCNANIKDVNNGEYTVNISYQYEGIGETQTNSTNFQVVPSIEITNTRWFQVGWIILTDKSTIGRNDNTTYYFKVSSNSANWTYTDLSATATTQSSNQGLVISPNPLTLEDIGPSGTSKEYSFGIASNNTPPGTYTVTICILSNGQYECAEFPFTFKVTE